MPQKTYTYDPKKITENGKDRLRFELGDTMVEGEAETCALSDEEYEAVLALNPKTWKKAKLAAVESILRRFSYEVDTKVGPLSLSLSDRIAVWKELADELKAETRYSKPIVHPKTIEGDHYFTEGMMDNMSAGGTEGSGRLDVPKAW